MVWLAIILLSIVVDRISKIYILYHVKFDTSITVIDKFFYIHYWENKGAAWGILQNGRYLFIPLTIIILTVLAYYLYKSQNTILKLSLSLIIGGASGNLIDRVYKGSVVDFLDFWFGSYNFPTFNIADSCIVVGTILLAYYLLFIYKDDDKKHNSEDNRYDDTP